MRTSRPWEVPMMSDHDGTRPNISRIYDYVLGGHHNFEVDRAAAEQIKQVFPSYPRWARMNRWFLQLAAAQWVEQGFQHILDLGSGMPAQDNMHEVAPAARVLYTDRDPITVAYAQEVLGTTARVRYIQADMREPAPILAEADAFFGGERHVAIGCIGLAYFLDDPTLRHLMATVHAWAAPGSVMALSHAFGIARTDANKQMFEMFKRSGAEMFMRDEATVRQMVAPWRVRACKTLAAWLSMEDHLDDTDREGGDAEMIGLILER
jgi:O-methyltransferase involved in polyketide biosynthesis